MKRFACAVVASAMLIAPILAQETATASAGEETRVGWIGSVGANCVANPAPVVTPAEVAGNGQIKLMKGEVQTNSVPDCPGITIPAIVVFYTSAPDFSGEDRFVLSVEGEGQSSQRTYTVTVGDGPAGTIPI